MQIERAYALRPPDLADCDFSFDIDSEALPPFEGWSLGATSPITPYRKAYPFDAEQFARISDEEQALFVAKSEGRLAGYILLSKGWQGCAQVEDLAVDRSFRRGGVANMLMNEAIRWAQSMNLPMVRLETQSNNLAACRFYEGYGFQLGGFDRFLCCSADPALKQEVALFWYLTLDKA